MNAWSRIAGRTRIIAILIVGVFMAAMISTVVRAIDTEPELEITFSHYVTRDQFQLAVVDIRNVGTAPAQYFGYLASNPACDVVYRASTGTWQERSYRCGLGLAPHLLLPGQQLSATNYVEVGGNWKVGLSYTKPTFQDRLPHRLRSLLRFLPLESGPYRQAWSPELPAVPVELAAAQGLLQ